MAIVSISRAAKLVRKGRQTLYNHNEKGKLSFTTTTDGKPGIDTAELSRVYGKLYLPADELETTGQSNVDTIGQQTAQDEVRLRVQSRVSNAVSMDDDTVSTLSWFMEQVDDVKEELAEAQAELEDREKRLTELRDAMAKLPSPESVELRLAKQAEHLKQQHMMVIETEREQQAKTLADQKEQHAKRNKELKHSIEERQQEIQQARAEAIEIREREKEQAEALKTERSRVAALESRGFVARLLNRKPVITE